MTAMMYAAQHENWEISVELMQLQADPTIPSNDVLIDISILKTTFNASLFRV